MKEYNCDLQLHGLYAGGVSKQMLIPVMAEQSRLKGIEVLVCADALHKNWFEHLKQNIVETENNVLMDKNQQAYFIAGTEVEDRNRIHHLIYLPSLESAQELREKFLHSGSLDCSMCGRPKLSLSAEQIAEKVLETGGITGPAHSFTPYTGIYAYFDSVKKAYGQMAENIHFIELGLSADTDLADTIAENHGYAFLSSSDAHSPWPNKLGREFNRIKMNKPTFSELKKALAGREEKLITLNAGLDPREGKYHATACNACYAQYSFEQAQSLNWKCIKCANQIKRGVRDRIKMLATKPPGSHPKFRPPYMHVIPLAEIIQIALGAKNANSQAVQSLWKDFVEAFGTEIHALVDAGEAELTEVHAQAAKKIVAFRSGWVSYIPGGGGKYGVPFIFDSEKEFLEKKDKLTEKTGKQELHGQKTLGEF
ncbi:MAG: TIGR00375 family protein [Candidatus Diapherotrites archaeon]|nr:TIGR00375 family protein [Candidatus Diapherotrites archaeon]